MYEKDGDLSPAELGRIIYTDRGKAMRRAEHADTVALGDIYEMRRAMCPLRGPDAGSHTVTMDDPCYETCGLGLYARRQRATTEELQHPSEELRDLMHLCKVAHQRRAGGLIWLSWRGPNKTKQGRKPFPAWGAMLIAASAWAARLMTQQR